MSDFVVYGSRLSPFVRKVEAVLGHTRTAYEFVDVNIMAMPDWFLEISPARRIPVLRDKTLGAEGIAGTIADSSAICLFLERRLQAGLYGETAYDTGRAAWIEEYADTVLAQTLGLELFRPMLFPRFANQPSDLETARKTWRTKLPPFFDYLESALDGKTYFVGDRYSVADIAVGCQMTQLDLVAGLPEAKRWPALVKHTEAARSWAGVAENLAMCAGMLKRLLPEKADLS